MTDTPCWGVRLLFQLHSPSLLLPQHVEARAPMLPASVSSRTQHSIAPIGGTFCTTEPGGLVHSRSNKGIGCRVWPAVLELTKLRAAEKARSVTRVGFILSRYKFKVMRCSTFHMWEHLLVEFCQHAYCNVTGVRNKSEQKLIFEVSPQTRM